ncbi:Calponin-homology, CH-domain-containing protein [Glarea lozoyensis ATCC 20868]|uniref:Calponin-homology, CH-domain-containing protein n=1 Tax=Glarea lozoyensis (strain ATCC 20868 / MF5171) TaxID=1116229 RepID=S3D455_GLAL2|nr:Calponin-homology, CH-domain-containing protein [Glarea lozoyensis ATCC 20868]EPE32600.1 Calponin-homology, CH-domain-containing protein [Glarea lozoyensis ATCC 20868]
MASVTSLDKDMRQLRMDRYTPQAAKEVRTFIEEALGERLQQADLLDALKDGVALCRLVNLAAPNTLKFKTRAVMPFVQMENISLFLQACRNSPFNLQSHDVFLTVDLFESKDPAQVLQCISAFSRAAHRIAPREFPNQIGGGSRGPMSPQRTGGAVGGGSYGGSRGRGNSEVSNSSTSYTPSASMPSALTPRRTGDSNGGRWSPTKKSGTPVSPQGGVSSWSKKSDEGATAPAWNIAQYGYMGGASQGNLGVSFGGRRQITSASPNVPNVAEKLRLRREKEAEEARLKAEAEEEEKQRKEWERQEEMEQERIRLEEEAAAARRAYELESQRIEEEKRRWAEQEKKWEIENQRRQEEERAHMEDLKKLRADSDAARRKQQENEEDEREALRRGISIEVYRAEKNGVGGSELARIKDLERQLNEAREREHQYQIQRQAKADRQSHRSVENHDMALHMKEDAQRTRNRSRSRPRAPPQKDSDEEWRKDEREYLRTQWNDSHSSTDQGPPPPSKSPRPLPTPTTPARLVKNNTGSRPLPDPAKYASKPSTPKPNPFSPPQNRTDKYLSSNPAPAPSQPKTTYSNEIGGFDSSAERDAEDRRRMASQTKTKAGGWASKSLLEREMELERQRQAEWEEGQLATRGKGPSGPRPLPSAR